MSSALHFTAWAWLGFALVAYSLKCHYCVRENPRHGCSGRTNACFARDKQKCIAVTVTFENKLKYRMEGCTRTVNDCTRKRTHPAGYTVNVTCCVSNLCNHWDHDHDD